jgi:hypothetical protein
MDLFLFALGLIGAIITIYVAKQEVIPEFRPLFDLSAKLQDAKELRDRNHETRQQIDDVQKTLMGGVLPANQLKQLSVALETSQKELDQDLTQLIKAEHDIKQSQVISRSIGFLLYAVLGGVIASLLSDKVTVVGFDATLPKQFQAILIGASWTGFLSVIGFSTTSKEVGQEMDNVKKDVLAMIDKKVEESKAKGQTTLPVDELKKSAGSQLDTARLSVQRTVRGIL